MSTAPASDLQLTANLVKQKMSKTFNIDLFYILTEMNIQVGSLLCLNLSRQVMLSLLAWNEFFITKATFYFCRLQLPIATYHLQHPTSVSLD